MKHNALTIVAATCLIATALGCAKKPPKTLPADGPPPEILAPPAPTPPPSDKTEQALPSDLQELNAELARTGLVGDIFFALNEYTLDSVARDRLVKNAEFFLAHREYQLTIEGHCDERGTNEYNLALGDRRASTASAHLSSLGVAVKPATRSYGEERPLCHESSESCWTKNRRAHFVITGRREGS
jgi:peptidoglycan-associated lipoprotein